MNIIDADGHIVETPSDLRRHLPPPYSKRTGALLPSDGMDTNMGGMLGGMEHNDVPTRLKDMDKEGIDVSVLFPTSSFSVNSLIERDYAVAIAFGIRTQGGTFVFPVDIEARLDDRERAILARMRRLRDLEASGETP